MLLNGAVCNFGNKAPNFNLSSFDKKFYSRDQLVGAKGFLIAFIFNHCPYVNAGVTNFVADTQRLQPLGVQTVAIMFNDYISHQSDNLEK